MQRISTEPDGVFKNGVPGVQRGTKFNAEWCNAVQEELANFIQNGVDPEHPKDLDPDNSGQLLQTLFEIFAAGLSLGDSVVHGSGSGANSSATLNHDKLGVAATGDVAVELHAEFLKLIRGQKTAQIGTKIESNNIVVIINEIVELAKNLIVKGLLKIEGNAQFDGDVGITGALNVVGGVRSEGGFSGGISGRDGESANYPLIRADRILPRTNGGRISISGNDIGLSGVLSGVFSGVWIPGETNYFSRTSEVINPVNEMANLPDGSIAVFYGHPTKAATYIIQWWDMSHTLRDKTVNYGTPFVFMKKKNSQNQNCGLLLSVGEA